VEQFKETVGCVEGVLDADCHGDLVTDVSCLRLNEVRIPMHTVRDQNARLECHFDLEGEALYSVKWYKDGNEFFRYVPRDQPPAQLFPLPGVTVDVSTCWGSQLERLLNLCTRS
jgi:hypothetical protein